MNISEAKTQIKNTVRTYLRKDPYGNYRLPPKRQRPVFLIGAPGIGKTAIMEQLAGELGIGLISYSMIHHTRQSALGLPYIIEKNYRGKTYSVSEYTMSEIIASVYDLMEETGIKEGILFLDEVNCVSETLAPAMLQFLQFKTFGRHALPEGWVVVTAGNPPEFNTSARRFDIVTLDRLKVIEVEADLGAWKEYALSRHAHPAVIAYLDARKEDFCRVEATVDGKRFVTPRGWDDLSVMMKEYEDCEIEVNEALIAQYLRDPRTSKEFFAYYQLYRKYERKYSITDILRGDATEAMIAQVKKGSFDEWLSLIGLVVNALLCRVDDVIADETELRLYRDALKNSIGETDRSAALQTEISRTEKTLRSAKSASSLSETKRAACETVLRRLKSISEDDAFRNGSDDRRSDILKNGYEREVCELANRVRETKEALNNTFDFMEKAFGDGNEMLIFVTELTTHRNSVTFISKYGCEKYFDHDRELLFYDRRREVQDALEELESEQ